VIETLGLLLVGHALADYPLQGNWLSRAKNHRLQPIPGEVIWPHALASHAMIHAWFVYAVTGSSVLALCELVAHSVIDWLKCDGRIDYNVDQGLHVVCKLAWVVCLARA
jgi:hypothetical protein